MTKPLHQLIGIPERGPLEQRSNRAHKPPLADRLGSREKELGSVPRCVLKPGRIIVIGVGKRLGALYAGDQLIIGQRLDRLPVTADAASGGTLVHAAILSGITPTALRSHPAPAGNWGRPQRRPDLV